MNDPKLPIIDDDGTSSSPPCADSCDAGSKVESKVPMTPTLETLLNPGLHTGPIFSSRLNPPKGEKVYALSDGDILEIRERRGAVVDLHPGMGGVAPDVLRNLINKGAPLTSIDFMVTQNCNFSCTWCFAESAPGREAYLPFAKMKSITQEAAKIGVELFILTGGEPLVYKDPVLGPQKSRGDHFFKVVEMIRDTYKAAGKEVKILTFDDVALITPQIAKRFADNEVGLCTKGDTLNGELQDFKVNQVGAFAKMQEGYENLRVVGYGSNPKLRLVVNTVLDHTTFDGMVDLHNWVMERGFDHSIVPIHYCGNAVGEDQEMGIHSPHVKVLYDLLARIDGEIFGIKWTPRSAFTYDKTCNRNMSGLHVRANGDVTACSESPGRGETDRYTFGNALDKDFSLTELAHSERLARYREEFAAGQGEYVCAPQICDLNANDLCRGGCATRSAYSFVDRDSGLIVPQSDPNRYSEQREDPLCPAWTVLALRQGVLKKGLLKEIHDRLLENSSSIDATQFSYLGPEI